MLNVPELTFLRLGRNSSIIGSIIFLKRSAIVKHLLLFILCLLAMKAMSENIMLPINSSNLTCHIEGHVNANPDGPFTIYRAYARYNELENIPLEHSFNWSYDYEEAASFCRIVEDVLDEAAEQGGFLPAQSETVVRQHRMQDSDGSHWAPRPSCRYTIYTIIETSIVIIETFILEKSSYSSETFSDECAAF
jgi:hypothetical protein